MRISFRRDILANYMVIENVEGFSEDKYGVKMLEYNFIRNLLKFDYENINGKINFLYDISSKQTMTAFFETEKFTYERLCDFAYSLENLAKTLGEYLLDANNVMLKKECIFMDLKTGKYRYCYNPYYNGDLKMEMGVIFDELLGAVDYEDPKAVKLAYDLNRECHRENFTIGGLSSLIEGDSDKEEKADQKKDTVLQDNTGLHDVYENLLKPERPFENAPAQAEPSPRLFKKLSFYLKEKTAYDVAEDIDGGKFREKIRERGSLYPDENERTPQTKEKRKKRADKTAGEDVFKAMVFNEPSWYAAKKQSGEDSLFEEINLDISQTDEDGLRETTLLDRDDEGNRKLVGINRQKGQVIDIDRYPFTIGKLKDRVNSVSLSPAVSRMHCRIHETSGKDYLFEDLNSKNGSYVNNIRIDPYSKIPLHPGDIIKIADEEYAFR